MTVDWIGRVKTMWVWGEHYADPFITHYLIEIFIPGSGEWTEIPANFYDL